MNWIMTELIRCIRILSIICKLSAIIGAVIIFTCTFEACTKQKGNSESKGIIIKTIETSGHVVPHDSISKPSVYPIDENQLTKIPVGEPKVVPTNTNIHPIPSIEPVSAGKPNIIQVVNEEQNSLQSSDSINQLQLNDTINKSVYLINPATGDTLQAPKVVPAIDSPFLAGIPEVITAKDAYIRDNNPHNFSSFSKLQGLRHDVIGCMLEDKSGNLWLGTNGGGVSKFDGQSFTHYSEKEGLANNSVLSILEDRNGNLWIGTYGGGVSKFDGLYFTHFTEEEGLSSNVVLSILEDQHGNLWFGTYGGGVSRLSSDGQRFTHFTTKEGLSNNIVRSILEDKSGNLWFGTYGGGVSKLSNDGHTFTHYTQREGLSNNIVGSILEDKEGNFWFCTYAGVSKFDGQSFTNFTVKEGLSNNIILSVLEDHSGNLWFGTYGGGVSKYDGKYFVHFTEKEGFSNNIIRSILEDKSGNLWFGTNGGVSKYDGQTFTHFTENEGLSNNIVLSILEDKNGNLWLGTNGRGVSRLSSDGRSFTHFTEKEGLSNNIVWSILEEKNGSIWFGTNKGVSKYDGQNFIHFTEKEGLSNSIVWSILEDKNSNLWFGTNGGVSKYNGQSFTNYSEKEGLSNNVVRAISEDKNGNLWFGTNGGVSKFDGQDFTLFTEKEGLSNNIVRSILEDHSGNIWLGTYGGGVSRLSADNTCFTHFTELEGLSNNYVFALELDNQGGLWFGTRFGLSRLGSGQISKLQKAGSKQLKLSVNEVLFKTYTYEDGFLGIGVNGGNTGENVYEANDGTIWIATNDRLTAYHPEGDVPDTIAPNIQISGIALFNENIEWVNLSGNFSTTTGKELEAQNKAMSANRDTTFTLGNGVQVGDFEFDGITRWYGLPENLSLAYNNNFLTFSYIGITQKQSRKVKYQYKLEGLDENWSALTSRTEAPYGNLPHGSYTFKVKAMNSEGYWSPDYNYSFIIRPPWWETWWFRTLAVAFIIGLIFTYIKWRERKLLHEKEVLEEKVQIRTSELKQANEEILIKNETLNQQNEEITAQRDLVTEQKEQIEEINKEISDSIRYANRIQRAVLPADAQAKSLLGDFFIIFRPHSVVSGDFYWATQTEDHTIITVADCTGHGVPGAFMSMLGISFLNEIVRKKPASSSGRDVPDSAEILNQLRSSIIDALKQRGENLEAETGSGSNLTVKDGMLASQTVKDGMDMSILTINKKPITETSSYSAMWAGANNPVWIISETDKSKSFEDNADMIKIIKGDSMPVAIHEEMRNFTNHELELFKGDQVYLFSDGFPDQFGGPKGKKFMYGKFKQLIAETSTLSMPDQGQKLEQVFEEWINWNGEKYDQVDDVTVMGIKI